MDADQEGAFEGEWDWGYDPVQVGSVWHISQGQSVVVSEGLDFILDRPGGCIASIATFVPGTHICDSDLICRSS